MESAFLYRTYKESLVAVCILCGRICAEWLSLVMFSTLGDWNCFKFQNSLHFKNSFSFSGNLHQEKTGAFRNYGCERVRLSYNKQLWKLRLIFSSFRKSSWIAGSLVFCSLPWIALELRLPGLKPLLCAYSAGRWDGFPIEPGSICGFSWWICSAVSPLVPLHLGLLERATIPGLAPSV